MHDQAAEPRKGYLNETFARGIAAARNQIPRNNSGNEDVAPTKANRPTTMDPTRCNDAEMEKLYPGHKQRMAQYADQSETDDGNTDEKKARDTKRTMVDEVSCQRDESPRARLG